MQSIIGELDEEKLQHKFKKVFKDYKKIGWYLVKSGAVKYIIDNEGKKAVVAFSHNERMREFLKLVR